jgi:hypothetical protein
VILSDLLVAHLERLLASPRRPSSALEEYEAALMARQSASGRVIRLGIRLYDPELSPSWVPRLWPTSRWLIETVAQGASVPEIALTGLLAELSRMSDLLRDNARAIPRLEHQVTPLAAFHVLGWTQTGADQLYRLVAPLIHVRVRLLERGMVERADVFGSRLARNLSDYLCSGRLLIRYSPPAIEAALAAECHDALTRSALGPARVHLLESVLARWTRAQARADGTVKKRRAHLEVLLGLEDHTIDPVESSGLQGRARGGWGARARESAEADADRGWSGLPVVSDVLPSVPTEAWVEGETGADYVSSDARPHIPEADRPPPRDHRSRDLATMQGLGLVHELSTAQPSELAEVYRRILDAPLARMTVPELEETLYLMLLVEHGISPESLHDMVLVDGEPSQASRLALDLAALRVWTRLPVIAAQPPSAIAAAFLSGSSWATTPLLPPARDLLRLLCERASRTYAIGAMPFGGTDLPTRLKARLRGTAVGGRPPDKLVARLARSGMRWLVHAGLPRVVAAEISGRLDVATRAASAYINMAEAQVTRLHSRAVSRFRTGLQAEWAHRGLPALDLGNPETTPVGSDRRFGSHLVPRRESITRAVHALEARLRVGGTQGLLDEVARAFNRQVLYEYFRISWATAVRPIRDPVVTWARWQDGWLLISDKSNRYSLESRLVPLLEEAPRRLSRLTQRGEHVRWRLRMAGWPVAAEAMETPFFLVRDRGAVALTPQEVRRVLAEEGLAELFPWPLNAPRHVWITRALEEGESLTVLEPFLGHVHEPIPWAPFSLASLAEGARAFRAFARRMVREAGFCDAE